MNKKIKFMFFVALFSLILLGCSSYTPIDLSCGIIKEVEKTIREQLQYPKSLKLKNIEILEKEEHKDKKNKILIWYLFTADAKYKTTRGQKIKKILVVFSRSDGKYFYYPKTFITSVEIGQSQKIMIDAIKWRNLWPGTNDNIDDNQLYRLMREAISVTNFTPVFD